MMSNPSNASRGGISFLGVLAIVFITLKLCGVIQWSWWLVLLPLYGPAGVIISIILALTLLAFIVKVAIRVLEELSKRK